MAHLKQFQNSLLKNKKVKCYFKIVTAIEPKQGQVSECPKQGVIPWVCSGRTAGTHWMQPDQG